jgi:hypothetical protein
MTLLPKKVILSFGGALYNTVQVLSCYPPLLTLFFPLNFFLVWVWVLECSHLPTNLVNS